MKYLKRRDQFLFEQEDLDVPSEGYVEPKREKTVKREEPVTKKEEPKAVKKEEPKPVAKQEEPKKVETPVAKKEPEKKEQTKPTVDADYVHYVVPKDNGKKVIIRNDTITLDAKGQLVAGKVSAAPLGELLTNMGVKDKVDFAMNCALFHEPPQGLLGENTGAFNFEGKKITPVNNSTADNFGMHDFTGVGRNAVLVGNKEGGWSIVPSDKWNGTGYYAIQNGPILVWEFEDASGNKTTQISPAFQGNKMKGNRNGIGIDKDGNLHFFMVEKDTSFKQFSNYIKDMGCIKAIFCDGVVSQVFDKGAVKGAGSKLGPVILVMK